MVPALFFANLFLGVALFLASFFLAVFPIEHGNAFEAEVVKGVEDAGEADKRVVRTHEVPQDDVPKEYLDKK